MGNRDREGGDGEGGKMESCKSLERKRSLDYRDSNRRVKVKIGRFRSEGGREGDPKVLQNRRRNRVVKMVRTPPAKEG